MGKVRKMQNLLKTRSQWTKGVDARDKWGREINCQHKRAIRFCLAGAVEVYYPNSVSIVNAKINNAIRQLFGKYSLVSFNDAPDTNFKKIREVIELADV